MPEKTVDGIRRELREINPKLSNRYVVNESGRGILITLGGQEIYFDPKSSTGEKGLYNFYAILTGWDVDAYYPELTLRQATEIAEAAHSLDELIKRHSAGKATGQATS
jgi:hypothetical protein